MFKLNVFVRLGAASEKGKVTLATGKLQSMHLINKVTVVSSLAEKGR